MTSAPVYSEPPPPYMFVNTTYDGGPNDPVPHAYAGAPPLYTAEPLSPPPTGHTEIRVVHVSPSSTTGSTPASGQTENVYDAISMTTSIYATETGV